MSAGRFCTWATRLWLLSSSTSLAVAALVASVPNARAQAGVALPERWAKLQTTAQTHASYKVRATAVVALGRTPPEHRAQVLSAIEERLQHDAHYAVRAAAGLSYTVSLATIALFYIQIRLRNWPVANGAFNVWVNLPLFDPTTGGDVVFRLQRDGRINMVLGILLPFVIPALVQIGTMIFSPLPLNHPQSQIWLLCAWAFLPASMLMRGIAMLRIAELIEEKRRRAYANAEALQAA